MPGGAPGNSVDVHIFAHVKKGTFHAQDRTCNYRGKDKHPTHNSHRSNQSRKVVKSIDLCKLSGKWKGLSPILENAAHVTERKVKDSIF